MMHVKTRFSQSYNAIAEYINNNWYRGNHSTVNTMQNVNDSLG